MSLLYKFYEIKEQLASAKDYKKGFDTKRECKKLMDKDYMNKMEKKSKKVAEKKEKAKGGFMDKFTDKAAEYVKQKAQEHKEFKEKVAEEFYKNNEPPKTSSIFNDLEEMRKETLNNINKRHEDLKEVLKEAVEEMNKEVTNSEKVQEPTELDELLNELESEGLVQNDTNIDTLIDSLSSDKPLNEIIENYDYDEACKDLDNLVVEFEQEKKIEENEKGEIKPSATGIKSEDTDAILYDIQELIKIRKSKKGEE